MALLASLLKRVGFLVNPIAGMGGRVGLKGTDGVLEEALAMGAKPVAPGRALEALRALSTWAISKDIQWLTCRPPMGGGELEEAGISSRSTDFLYRPPKQTTGEDTTAACELIASSQAEIILFCGGDGTARDILDAVDGRLPILGIPAGVKMHSAVFGLNPGATAATLARFLMGELPVGEAEVLDIDEEKYRSGDWSIKLHGLARSPQEPNLVQTGKMMVQEVGDEAIREEIADYIAELMEEESETLFIFGPGGTTHGICRKLGLEKTLLGIDAVLKRHLVGIDLNEDGLLRLVNEHPKAKVVVSPIGAQGFVLGRGNLQLSPEVLRRIGPVNLMVVSTPAKLRSTPCLRFDTGNGELDSYFAKKGHILVVTGYRTMKLHPVKPP